VTGIEPAWPAWKASGTCSRLSVKLAGDRRVSVFDLDRCGRPRPHCTGRTAPLRPRFAHLVVATGPTRRCTNRHATTGGWDGATVFVARLYVSRGVVALLVLRMNGRYRRFMRSDGPVLAPTFRSRSSGGENDRGAAGTRICGARRRSPRRSSQTPTGHPPRVGRIARRRGDLRRAARSMGAADRLRATPEP
jgi:hypothetical protein